MTLVCVPIMVRDLTWEEDARAAKAAGADLIEWRLDEVFQGEGDEDGERLALRLCAGSPLPCIATCRPVWEGGAYDGDESARISLFERLGTSEHPPRYIDVELAAYTRSANVRQKVDLAVDARGRDRHSSLILSIHDFEGRPSDLMRRVTAAWGEARASVVKVAYRARSLRDNLELFEILREAPKPTIALGMGQFGLMSRVLAPKFGGFLTFAGLRKEAVTAPGQPTLRELLDMYRFRSIGKDTRVYGVIGWPVSQSMGPLVHNAGFGAVGHDGVYLPLPVAAVEGDEEGSYASFKASMTALIEDGSLGFAGASVTLPHKESLARLHRETDRAVVRHSGPIRLRADDALRAAGAANTLAMSDPDEHGPIGIVANTDTRAAIDLLREALGGLDGKRVCVAGAGGVARAVAFGLAWEGVSVFVTNRTRGRAVRLADEVNEGLVRLGREGVVVTADPADLRETRIDACVNCTPVGMAGGPDPDGMAIPVDEIKPAPETVFFDTVYNPIETPMLAAAKRWGCRTIDGVEMFVGQAALQFELWTGRKAPAQLFDRLVRETLS